jgi:hypothetical protein
MTYKFSISDLSLGLLALATFWSGLVYRLFGLALFGVVLSVTMTVLCFIILLKVERKHNQAETAQRAALPARYARIDWFLTGLYLVLAACCFLLLSRSGITGSIVSPWQAVPAAFFVIYFISSLTLFFLLGRGSKIGLVFAGIHFFLTYSVIIFVYKLGFGYDYFIHQATLELIDKQGVVDPRPLYYLGQYGLLTIIHKISCLPLAWLHRLLVPLLAAIFLPPLAYRALDVWFEKKIHPSFLLFFLAVPLPFLTFTTPQNFALLLLLFVILLSAEIKNIFEYAVAAALALAALVTHPVAGIPAVLLVLALIVRGSGLRVRFKRLSFGAIFILSAILLPLAFYLLEKPQIGAKAISLAGLLPALGLSGAGSDNIILNFVYFYGYNFWAVLLVLSAAGLCLARKYGRLHCFEPQLYVAGGLFVAYVLTKILPFNFLIGYEHDDYPERILLAACLFLAPFIILAGGQLTESIRRQNLIFKTGWLVFALLLMCASVYLAYPRFDRYFNSRGYSVGEADIAAVDWIEHDARGDYIVLANQQVSVAALSRFGFKKYYPGDIFYYPIPTGGPLYNYYLEMVYRKPTRETMAGALALAGVEQGYFVLNKYWTDFAKVLAEAKLSADSWQSIDNGQVYIFKFKLR